MGWPIAKLTRTLTIGHFTGSQFWKEASGAFCIKIQITTCPLTMKQLTLKEEYVSGFIEWFISRKIPYQSLNALHWKAKIISQTLSCPTQKNSWRWASCVIREQEAGPRASGLKPHPPIKTHSPNHWEQQYRQLPDEAMVVLVSPRILPLNMTINIINAVTLQAFYHASFPGRGREWNSHNWLVSAQSAMFT